MAEAAPSNQVEVEVSRDPVLDTLESTVKPSEEDGKYLNKQFLSDVAFKVGKDSQGNSWTQNYSYDGKSLLHETLLP